MGEFNSAVLLCAAGPSSATCQGDSGGPLVEGSPAVEVGLVDIGAQGLPGRTRPTCFTNVAAPEVRGVHRRQRNPSRRRAAELRTCDQVASEPRRWTSARVTCEPGAWSGSPSFTYTFEAENASAQVLQSGPSNVFAPPSAARGGPGRVHRAGEQRRAA